MTAVSKEQMNYIALEAKKELARRHYIHYCEYVHRGMWVPYKMHEIICEKLDEIVEGKNKRLIIAMPPRHGKSFTVTETLPSYFMGRWASRGIKRNVIQVSYSGDFALKFGLRNRTKVNEFGLELFNTSVSKEQATKGNWALDNGATMLSVGVGGPMTGEGADLMIIDDPIKNREEAESETIRQKIWDEWESTMSTRLSGIGSVVLIQTRWHEDDLAGRLIKTGDWEVLSLPAIAEDTNDLLGRKIGQALCPELGFDEKWATIKQREVGSRTWESLYQQRPTAAEGNIIKREWFKYYNQATKPAQFDQVTQSWDFAFKDTDGSDYVAGGVFGKKGPDHYLLYRIKKRLDFVGSINEMIRVSNMYPEANLKLVEDKANGSAVISMLRKKMHGIVAVTPRESKEARTYAVTPIIESGNFYIPEDAEWVEDYVNEMVSFPNGKNDDQVDMTTQYLKRHINPSQAITIDTSYQDEDDGWLFDY